MPDPQQLLLNRIERLETLVDQLRRADRAENKIVLRDGVSAPAAVSAVALVYVDVADGDLKIRFADGTTKTIVTDT